MSHALQFLVVTMAGWLTRHQQALIDYLKEENRILREQISGQRLHLTDEQRRRLAVRGKVLGRKELGEVAGIATPDTILRWYRTLIAKKYDGSTHRGRPITPAGIIAPAHDMMLGLHPRRRRWILCRLLNEIAGEDADRKHLRGVINQRAIRKSREIVE